MSTVFYTSDAHIGHVKVSMIRAETFGGPTDPDAAVAWNSETQARNWDSVVTPDDVVWVCGDISSGTSPAQRAALAWFAARPGIKHFISGNHDGVHPSNRDFYKWFEAYSTVFDSVSPFARRKIAGRSVMVSHFPYEGDHTEAERMMEYRLRDEGMPLIHGHTHAAERVNGRMIHVGVDAWDMAPVPSAEIEKIVAGMR